MITPFDRNTLLEFMFDPTTMKRLNYMVLNPDTNTNENVIQVNKAEIYSVISACAIGTHRLTSLAHQHASGYTSRDVDRCIRTNVFQSPQLKMYPELTKHWELSFFRP